MSIFSPYPHITTKYPSFLNECCPICNSPVEFKYPGRKRTVKDFFSNFTETRYYYSYTNSNCYNNRHAFNPSSSYTLPEKHYSKSVWKWIGREAKIYNSNATKISERIFNEFELNISENTIRNVIDEIDGYLVNKIDEETIKRIKVQGKIVICMDGQKPEDGKDSLWLFTDVISNRVLDVQLLSCADHQTLYESIEKILNTYEVELVGILSDKQGSIVKMHDKYYPKIPHQYCHFHFLQNLWNFIEIRDSALQTTLRTTINHLPLTTMSKESTRILKNKNKVNYRSFFAEIEQDLRKLVKNRGKKFDKLRGLESFDRIKSYIGQMQQVCIENPPEHRITKILTRNAEKLKEIIDKMNLDYHSLHRLNDYFQEIRKCLGAKISSKHAHEEQIQNLFEKIWESIKLSRHNIEDIKAILPNKNMSNNEAIEQWYRMYNSYSKGLFQYYEFPIQERTNSKMEQHFGLEKSTFIQQSGKSNVSRQIRVRGEYVLKMQYVPKKELISYLEELPGDYSRDNILKHLQELQKKQEQESNRCQSRIGGIDALRALYNEKKDVSKK